MSDAITFTGLGSGIDLASIVTQLVETEQYTINRMETWKSDWENKITALQGLNTRMLALRTTAGAMDTPAEFQVKTASSSDENVLTTSADSAATPGSYSVKVGDSIQHRLGSDGKPDKDTTDYAVSGDTIDITVDGTNETITINGGDYTLQGIADEIDLESALVTAEVIDDGSKENEFRLILTAKEGGASKTISIGTNTTDVNFAMSAAGERIDDVEEGTWTGTSSASSGGQYLGTTNKTFQFEVTSSGEDQVVETDDITLHWEDGEGNKGDITFDSSYTADTLVDVFQGVKVSLSAGNVDEGDTFSIDVWHPDLQAAQDEGLAKTEKEVHSGFSDTDTTAVTSADADFSYTYNGRETTITVSAGTTLTELKDLINNDSQNPGVTASILNDGTGLSTAFHLVLSGDQTGAAYKITSISHTLDNFDSTFDETQAAQNAMLKVDGYPSGSEYIQKSTNHITDVIEGVTLSLVGTGTSTVTVNPDTEAMKQKITDFISAFNEVRAYIKEQTKYDDDTGEAGILLGNYAVEIVKSRLDAIVSTNATGFRDGKDTYVNLMQIGIRTDVEEGSETEGQLLIDETELDNALASDFEAVADLFAQYYVGRSPDTSKLTYKSYINGITRAGTYEIKFDSADPSSSQMRLKGSTDWDPADWDATEKTLTGKSDYPESGLVVKVEDTGADFTAEVDLKLGISGTLQEELQDLTSSTSGPIYTLEDNYNDIIDNIDKKIERETARIALYEKRLTERFARLEGVLSQLNGLSIFLTQQLTQLIPGQ